MDVPMRVIQCCKCHLPFAVPSEFEMMRKKDHQDFYCPMGHGQHFVAKSDEEILRQKLKENEQELVGQKEMLTSSRAALQKVQKEHRERIADFVKKEFKAGTKTISLHYVMDKFNMKKMREALSDVRIAGMSHGFVCKKLSDGKYHIVKIEKENK